MAGCVKGSLLKLAMLVSDCGSCSVYLEDLGAKVLFLSPWLQTAVFLKHTEGQ